MAAVSVKRSISLGMVRSEERRLYSPQRYIETVISAKCVYAVMHGHELLLFNRTFNPCSMNKGR